MSSEPVVAAFSIGWRLAEVYNQESFASKPAPTTDDLPAHLPGASEMSYAERATIRLQFVKSALGTFTLVALDDEISPDAVISDVTVGAASAQIRLKVLRLFEAIRDGLASAHPPAQTALGLGRMLADTCGLPTSTQPETFGAEFRAARLENAYTWLGELSQALPTNSADVVAGSLRRWADWVADPTFDARRDRRQVKRGATVAIGPQTTRYLRSQGDIWRRILEGEQDPAQLLRPDDYVTAGRGMMQRFRAIATAFLIRWSFWIILGLAVVGAVGYLALRYAASPSAKAVAVGFSALAALGVTWKGVGATLGKALAEVQKPLWDAELKQALVEAATRLPTPVAPAGQAATPVSGSGVSGR